MQLRKATRQKAKLRIGLSGASGSGKTYSAILLASGISDISKVAFIDTENGSADLYSNLGDFNVITLQAPFSPERYIEAIKVCEDAGMETIIIDSVSHEWDGVGGCLEIQEKLGGKYQDWAKVTPRHKKFIEKILESPCHVITCSRRKQDYDMVKGSNGRLQVQKVGLKEVQRDGFEYELTIAFEINDLNMVKASKDRTQLFADVPEFKITKETGEQLLSWANNGIEKIDPRPVLTEEIFNEKVSDIATNLIKSGKQHSDVIEQIEGIYQVSDYFKEKISGIKAFDMPDDNWDNPSSENTPSAAPAEPAPVATTPPSQEVPAEAPKQEPASEQPSQDDELKNQPLAKQYIDKIGKTRTVSSLQKVFDDVKPLVDSGVFGSKCVEMLGLHYNEQKKSIEDKAAKKAGKVAPAQPPKEESPKEPVVPKQSLLDSTIENIEKGATSLDMIKELQKHFNEHSRSKFSESDQKVLDQFFDDKIKKFENVQDQMSVFDN